MAAKLPAAERAAAAGDPDTPQQGSGATRGESDSEFLDALLGSSAPCEPAILPAPGQFSLVGQVSTEAFTLIGRQLYTAHTGCVPGLSNVAACSKNKKCPIERALCSLSLETGFSSLHCNTDQTLLAAA